MVSMMFQSFKATIHYSTDAVSGPCYCCNLYARKVLLP